MTPHSAPAQTPQSKGWSPARRAAQAEAIRRWQPWAKSTGPKTAAGKARVAQNAAKVSRGCRLPDPDRRMKRALKNHEAYLTDLNRFISACKKFPKNKLLKECKKHFYKRGLKTRQGIIDALLYARFHAQLPPPSLRGGTADEAIHPPRSPERPQDGLPRRFAPRNDNKGQ